MDSLPRSEDTIQDRLQYNNLLFDFYGELLTEKQKSFFVMYYMEDYSLSEIGTQYHITPQAVADLLKRTCAVLNNYESRLKLISAHQAQKNHVRSTLEALDGIISEAQSESQRVQLARIRQMVAEMPDNN